jgi:hypothetical protein
MRPTADQKIVNDLAETYFARPAVQSGSSVAPPLSRNGNHFSIEVGIEKLLAVLPPSGLAAAID